MKFNKQVRNRKDLNRYISNNKYIKRGDNVNRSKKRVSCDTKLFDDKELKSIYDKTKDTFREFKLLGKFNFLF